MDNKQKVYAKLDELGINYKVSNHPPIFTIDALDGYDIPDKDLIAKNLFLRNDNGKKHYLVVLKQDKQADLKDLRKKIGSSRLSFASEERLLKHLGLSKGSVTPLGIINDLDSTVELVFDKDLVDEMIIGVHPNENDATVWMSFLDLKSVIEHMGHKMAYVEI